MGGVKDLTIVGFIKISYFCQQVSTYKSVLPVNSTAIHAMEI